MSGFVDTDGTTKMCGSPPAGALETHCGKCAKESRAFLGQLKANGPWLCKACFVRAGGRLP